FCYHSRQLAEDIRKRRHRLHIEFPLRLFATCDCRLCYVINYDLCFRHFRNKLQSFRYLVMIYQQVVRKTTLSQLVHTIDELRIIEESFGFALNDMTKSFQLRKFFEVLQPVSKVITPEVNPSD